MTRGGRTKKQCAVTYTPTNATTTPSPHVGFFFFKRPTAAARSTRAATRRRTSPLAGAPRSPASPVDSGGLGRVSRAPITGHRRRSQRDEVEPRRNRHLQHRQRHGQLHAGDAAVQPAAPSRAARRARSAPSPTSRARSCGQHPRDLQRDERASHESFRPLGPAAPGGHIRPERRLRDRWRHDHLPDGRLPADPTLSGQANFGFVSKYQKGQSTPTGQTEFQFQTASSTSTASSTTGACVWDQGPVQAPAP